MRKLRWLAILMSIAILGITGFQGYWLKNNYDKEKQNLEIKTAADFRQMLLQLQSAKLQLDNITLPWDSVKNMPLPPPGRMIIRPSKRKRNLREPDTVSMAIKEPPITMINLLQEKMKNYSNDTGAKRGFFISNSDGFEQRIFTDSLHHGPEGEDFRGKIETISISTNGSPDSQVIRELRMNRGSGVGFGYKVKKSKGQKPDSVTLSASAGIFIERPDSTIVTDQVFEQKLGRNGRPQDAFIRFLYNVDSVSSKDSVTIKEITGSYSLKLKENKINGLLFSVNRLDSSHANSDDPNEVTIGFAKPLVFGLSLENKVAYILKKLTLPILFSVFLVGITIVSFVLLYRSLVRQRRLAELKNDFISNITHELKTPIATVGVAIEALKSFNAIHDPKRTQEYLDISQNELQRLSLLVDKVLKLSMFEKKEIELKKEQFDCKQLVEEVMTSMRLQFEKYHAKVKLHSEGDNFLVTADKLHITSVIYNLLDNALKYSKEDPVIDVTLKANSESIELSVSDNGIGIEPAYQQKIFDKFFRVPSGNKHNIKGYGLGLSYVAEVVKRHHGHVHAESELGKGSTFTAKLPHAG